MKNFLENTLRQKVSIRENKEIFEKLPLVYRGRYDVYNVETNSLEWIAISPKNSIGLVTLRKDRNKVEKELGLNCALFLNSVTFYMKEKLLDEGIPFVIKEKQIYLPFLGYLISNSKERDIAPVHIISYLTQKLLFTAIYERWNEINVSVAANKMGVSKMSISRCFDELEYLNIDVLGMKGKSRVVCISSDVKELWNRIVDYLRNPVVKRYVLSEDIQLEKKAGISALCDYSLLSDNNYPTYGITKKEIKESGVRYKKQILDMEEAGCVVLELGYFIDFDGKNIEDPLSVVLSLTEDEKNDERVMISIEDMLEGYVWSRD